MRMRLLVACLTSTFLAAVPVPRVDPSPPPPPPPPPPPSPPPPPFIITWAAGAAAVAQPLAPFDLPWDPEPLPRNWLTQFSAPPEDPAGQPPNCAAAKTALVGDGGYGRTNNELKEFMHLLEFAASRPASNLTVVVATDRIKKYFPPHLFDWDPLKSWVCISQDGPPPGTLELHESLFHIYYWDRRGHGQGYDEKQYPARGVFGVVEKYPPQQPWVDYHWLHGKVFAQLLLRPRGPLRAGVDAIIRKHGPRYVAIHLRQLEGQCQKRVRRERVRITREDLGREVTPEDICLASDEYLAAALAKDRVPREWPILILHDGQPLSVARVPQLIKRFGAVDVNATEPLVAMLLLAKSSYLVGNPGSTFSVNMADIRRASGASEASTTLQFGSYWDA